MAPRDTPTHVYLLRHARSAPDFDVPEYDWKLTSAGHDQARALVPTLQALRIDAIYSSPYLRARQTVAPFAQAVGLPVALLPELRERKLSERPVAAFEELVARCFDDPDFVPPGGESNRLVRERVRAAVAQLCARHAGQRLLLSTHGNALTIYLHALDPSHGFETWQRMRNPDLYHAVIDRDSRAVVAPSRAELRATVLPDGSAR